MKSDFAVRKSPLASLASKAPVLWILLSVLLATGPALGQGYDPAKANVTPVPANRWGDLQPAAILGDSSSFNFSSVPGRSNPFWYGMDAEGDYVFSATGKGLMVWDVRDPENPVQAAYVYAPPVVPQWQQSDLKFYLHGVDAPDGDPSVVAEVGVFGNGMLIWKMTDGSGNQKNLSLMYKDAAKTGSQVWSAKIRGTSYAFFAATNNKVLVYDLDAAKALSATCVDQTPSSLGCSGVYKGKINTQSGVDFLHGAGNYLAVSQGFLGVEIWNVSDPTQAQQVLKAAPPGITKGVALWQQGGSYYLAVVGTSEPALRIYDVGCIVSNNCPSSFGNPVGTFSVNLLSRFVTFSKKGSTPFLYIGGEDQFTGGPQREYLLDVSNLAQPTDITPQVHPEGYWGWYYFGNPTGFNWIMPRMGKFHGEHFYRAAYSLMDVHKFTGGGPPAADFTWSPSVIYTGDAVSFSDRSTGAPTAWEWTFADSPEGSSSAKNPSATFSSPGDKAVTLRVSKGSLQDEETKQVTVLDPAPQIGSLAVSPPNPVVCQPVTFTAQGVTGKPNLTYAWTVTNGAQSVNGSVNPFTWATGASTQTGAYTATVTVSNASGQATRNIEVTLGALQSIPAQGQFQPTNDPFDAGVVQFHAAVPGATAWSWDFGDGWTPWTDDPVSGPNPQHTYTTKGLRQVKVRVKNCTTPDQTLGIESAAIPIDILKTTPLKAQFAAQCPLGFCAFGIGESIPFTDSSTGAEFYDYDWDADGTYEDANNTTAKASHTYTVKGDYQPKLRVRRGTEVDVYQHAQVLKVLQITNNPPSLSISGPSSGDIGASLSFTASALNCTPSPGGWSWNAGGGTLSGSGSSVSISWSTTGTKSVTVSNTGCSGATGSKSVTIGNNNPQPTTLTANYTFLPSAPVANQPVSFDASSSGGSPTGWVWTFGDGTASASGQKVTHTFAQAGTYAVQLNVTKGSANCPPAPFCESSVTKTITVGTGEAPLGAAFETSANCLDELGFRICTAEAGKAVTFTDASTGNPTSWLWDFGDGETATGSSATHTFKNSGGLSVSLTVTRGSSTSTASKRFNITGGPVRPKAGTTVLPWIAQSRGPLVQSSDLYLHNPSSAEMEVTLQFRQRGLSEANPPEVKRTIQPGATLFVADVLRDLFDRENYTGFVNITLDKGTVDPVITSFNTTFSDDGSEFGQTVPGISLSSIGNAASSGTAMQYLIGLNDNSERVAYFGVTNPTDQPTTYRLKFFDSAGKPVGKGDYQLTLSRFGQKQYQPKDLRDLFGLHDIDDFRVQVETTAGGQLFPYGASIRVGSEDPSFIGTGTQSDAKVYLLGVLSAKGLNESLWQTDLVISNTTNEVVLTELTFTGTGVAAEPTSALQLTLQPGESRRLANVLEQWGLTKAVGVLTLDSDAPGGVFPLVQGESYENTQPTRRFGQSMPALAVRQAAGPNQGQYLAGLRQDAKSRTTLWVFNPGDQAGDYDVIYRGLDGTELGRIATRLGPGKLRQLSPNQHPLPKEGVPGGFTVQVVVKSGKVLAAAQVINNVTNDPAYIQGETR